MTDPLKELSVSYANFIEAMQLALSGAGVNLNTATIKDSKSNVMTLQQYLNGAYRDIMTANQLFPPC